MVPTGYVSPCDGRVEYRVPASLNGVEITRAVGRLCSGDTLLPIPGAPVPVATLEQHSHDGTPFYVCTNF